MRSRTWPVLVAALVLTACAPGPPDGGPASRTTPAAPPTSETAPAEGERGATVTEIPADAARARELGSPVGVAGLVVVLLWPETTGSTAVDGVRELRFQAETGGLMTPAGDPATTDVLLLAPPDGWTLEAEGDGSVVALDGTGTARAAATPPAATAGARARWHMLAPDLAALRASGSGTDPTGDVGAVEIRATLADRALVSATWGDREGGRSLAVEPAGWIRTGGDAALHLLRTELVAAEPEAGSTTMDDQLTCHALGAPDKATWNLEPWRPDVGLLGVLAAACNHT